METFPSNFTVASYNDALAHIRDHHGEEGKSIATDPDHAPTIWHEIVHLEGVTDHVHEGGAEMHEQQVRKAFALVENPLFVELLKLESVQEEIQQAMEGK